MLYDILIIDDALQSGFLSTYQKKFRDSIEKIFTTQTDDKDRAKLIEEILMKNDAETLDAFQVRQLILNLINDNLRVTWTTGELDDLEKLKAKDLSEIRYIFQDLHLQGTNNGANYRTINSKIMGILDKLNNHMKRHEVVLLINSKFKDINYGEEGKGDLEKKLKDKFDDKYSIDFVESKNTLSNEQKEKLREHNLQVYLKTMIINKVIEIEKVFDDKLDIDKNLRDVITFGNKYKKIRKAFDLKKEEKQQISLLQQIRNKLAHTDGDLSSISDKSMQTAFWKIVSQSENEQAIEFENFENLMIYIESIGTLCNALKESKKIDAQ